MEKDRKGKDLKLEDKWAIAKELSLLEEEGEELVEVVEEVLDVEGLTIRMVRPCGRRRVRGNPNSSYFKPAGIRMVDLEVAEILMDEFEAIRLVDFKEFSQDEAGKKMNVSQSTLSRILKSGRKKIAGAIVEGKAIRISGN